MEESASPSVPSQPAQSQPAGVNTRPELLASVYQTLGSRRQGYDTMMWQVPAISFTAQAFLLTLALGGGVGIASLVSAALALVIALISMQLMSKHRFNEEIDSRLLEAFEKQVDIAALFGCPPHAPLDQRLETVNSGKGAYADTKKVRKRWYTSASSYRWWLRGLGLFAATSVGIIIVNVLALTGWGAVIARWMGGIVHL